MTALPPTHPPTLAELVTPQSPQGAATSEISTVGVGGESVGVIVSVVVALVLLILVTLVVIPIGC